MAGADNPIEPRAENPHELIAQNYDYAFSKLVYKASLDVVMSDPMFGSIKRRRLRHHEGSRNILDGSEARYEGREIPMRTVFNEPSIREGDLQELTKSLIEMGIQLLEGHRDMMMQHLGQASDLAGNSVDAQGRPPDSDLVLELMSRFPWKFTDGGAVDWSDYNFHPSIVELVRTLPKHPRWADVYREKLLAWKTSRKTRRLGTSADD